MCILYACLHVLHSDKLRIRSIHNVITQGDVPHLSYNAKQACNIKNTKTTTMVRACYVPRIKQSTAIRLSGLHLLPKAVHLCTAAYLTRGELLT